MLIALAELESIVQVGCDVESAVKCVLLSIQRLTKEEEDHQIETPKQGSKSNSIFAIKFD